jgi:hypothetical protein
LEFLRVEWNGTQYRTSCQPPNVGTSVGFNVEAARWPTLAAQRHTQVGCPSRETC